MERRRAQEVAAVRSRAACDDAALTVSRLVERARLLRPGPRGCQGRARRRGAEGHRPGRDRHRRRRSTDCRGHLGLGLHDFPTPGGTPRARPACPLERTDAVSLLEEHFKLHPPSLPAERRDIGPPAASKPQGRPRPLALRHRRDGSLLHGCGKSTILSCHARDLDATASLVVYLRCPTLGPFSLPSSLGSVYGLGVSRARPRRIWSRTCAANPSEPSWSSTRRISCRTSRSRTCVYSCYCQLRRRVARCWQCTRREVATQIVSDQRQGPRLPVRASSTTSHASGII